MTLVQMKNVKLTKDRANPIKAPLRFVRGNNSANKNIPLIGPRVAPTNVMLNCDKFLEFEAINAILINKLPTANALIKKSLKLNVKNHISIVTKNWILLLNLYLIMLC